VPPSPVRKYSQDDYYGLAAFFARVSLKGSEEFGIFGGEQVVWMNDRGEVSNPRSGKKMDPKPLDAPAVDHPLDRRLPLADWMTGKDNPLFARAVVNRYMSYRMGRGLVEPVDDMRSTNPASNPPLLHALAKHFVESGFNPKQLMRTIMQSRLYQLASANPGNIGDRVLQLLPEAAQGSAGGCDDRITGTHLQIDAGNTRHQLPTRNTPLLPEHLRRRACQHLRLRAPPTNGPACTLSSTPLRRRRQPPHRRPRRKRRR
jgi:hypothetical protein